MQIIFFLISCFNEPNDRQLYVDALKSNTIEEGLAICNEISNSDLAGECSLALNDTDQKGPSLEERCEHIPSGSWRDECYFKAAERAAHGRDLGRAVELCSIAGVFEQSCYHHLWQPEQASLLGPNDSAAFTKIEKQAKEGFETWNLLLQNQGFGDNYWDHLFTLGFEKAEKVNLLHCEGLETHLYERCYISGIKVEIAKKEQNPCNIHTKGDQLTQKAILELKNKECR